MFQNRALTDRRHQLLQRSGQIRQQLVADASAMGPWLGLADQMRVWAHWLQRNPLWVAAAVAGLTIARPRKAFRWGMRLWSVWRTLQRVRGAVARAARHL